MVQPRAVMDWYCACPDRSSECLFGSREDFRQDTRVWLRNFTVVLYDRLVEQAERNDITYEPILRS